VNAVESVTEVTEPSFFFGQRDTRLQGVVFKEATVIMNSGRSSARERRDSRHDRSIKPGDILSQGFCKLVVSKALLNRNIHRRNATTRLLYIVLLPSLQQVHS
jgi:hypothetical protein